MKHVTLNCFYCGRPHNRSHAYKFCSRDCAERDARHEQVNRAALKRALTPRGAR